MASLVKRGENYYVQWRVGAKIKRQSLRTDSLQIAKEKLRQFESARIRGDDLPLPTRTGIPDILAKYVEHVRTIKTPKSAQTDVYYLRQMFGPICPVLQINSRKASIRAMKKPPKPGQDRRFKMSTIDVSNLEEITTTDVANFIGNHVRSMGLAPKTANRYREIIHTFFNWAMQEQGVKMPNGVNPVSNVSKYKEHAPKIRFLTLPQVEEQLRGLERYPQLQVMVSVLIYSGLRREELLWLTLDDVDLQAGAFGILRVWAKTIQGESWQPKTKQNRAVPISSTLRRYLERYVPRLTPEKWFLPSPQGKRYDPDNFSRDLRIANRKAGLQWTYLDFRHTFGSQLAMKGESLYKISVLMGNSPEICRRHYAVLIPETMVDSVEFDKKEGKKYKTA